MDVNQSFSHSEHESVGVDKSKLKWRPREKEWCLWSMRFKLHQRGEEMKDGEGEGFL